MQKVFLRHGETASLSIAAFFQKLNETLFTPQFDTYEHLTFLNNPDGFKWIIFGLYFGLVAASLFMFYNKNVLGELVRRLDIAGAHDRDSAKTLSELGLEKNIFCKISLKRGNSIRKAVCIAPAEDEELPEDISVLRAAAQGRKCSPLTDRFYIPAEKCDTIVDRFNPKGSGWLSVLLMIILGIVLVIAIFKFAPFIAGLIEQAIASAVGES